MSRPRNEEGYFLIDAVVMLLVTSLCAGTVLASIGIVVRRATDSAVRTGAIIEARNADAERALGLDASER